MFLLYWADVSWHGLISQLKCGFLLLGLEHDPSNLSKTVLNVWV